MHGVTCGLARATDSKTPTEGLAMNNSEQANAAGGAPALVTPDEAAELMRVCKRTVTRLCDDGELKAVKVRNQWRINREALLAYCGLAG
ncbi:MAG: hypothetical protein DBX56_02620 [Coriobacteriia bacterium]|nr:MAG: hypothetical protein DBX56_02620 [Coriobacteriia bacterium]